MAEKLHIDILRYTLSKVQIIQKNRQKNRMLNSKIGIWRKLGINPESITDMKHVNKFEILTAAACLFLSMFVLKCVCVFNVTDETVI